MPERTYKLYLHSSKESARDAAREAGYTDEQIDHLDLQYVGYEEEFEVTVLDPDHGPVHVRHVRPASNGYQRGGRTHDRVDRLTGPVVH